jgi:hypothetical protein
MTQLVNHHRHLKKLLALRHPKITMGYHHQKSQVYVPTSMYIESHIIRRKGSILDFFRHTARVQDEIKREILEQQRQRQKINVDIHKVY